jgi:hypothetical protein
MNLLEVKNLMVHFPVKHGPSPRPAFAYHCL